MYLGITVGRFILTGLTSATFACNVCPWISSIFFASSFTFSSSRFAIPPVESFPRVLGFSFRFRCLWSRLRFLSLHFFFLLDLWSSLLKSESEDESADDSESESESESVKNRDSLYEISERAIRQAFAIHVLKHTCPGFDHMSSIVASQF